MLLHNMLGVAALSEVTAGWDNWDGTADGDATVFESASCNYIASCVLDATRVLVAYQDGGNSFYGTAVVLTIDGTSISVGSYFVFSSANTSQISVGLIDEDKVIVSYRDGANSYYGAAIVITTDGSTISAGTPFVFESASTSLTSIAILDNTRAVVSYQDGGNSSYGTAIVLTVSGTSITAGGPVVFRSADTRTISSCTISSDRVLVTFRDVGNSYFGTAVVLEIDGSSVTAGSTFVFNSYNTGSTSVRCIDENKAIVAFQSLTDHYFGAVAVLSVSGTSISAGSQEVFDDDGYASIVVESLDSTTAIVSYADTGYGPYGTAAIITIDGTSCSALTAHVFHGAYAVRQAIQKLDGTRVVIVYANASNSNYGTSIVLNGA